jgi:O-antigen ligase
MRFYSYLYHGLLALFLFAISLLALISDARTLHLDMLPWKGTTLTYIVFFAALFGLAAVLLAFKGRMTNLDDAMEQGTAQTRIQLWSEGLQLFKRDPLFGIGQNNYVEEVGQAAHNSFLHAFTELGIFGGALFLGAYAAAMVSIEHRC